MMSQKVVPSTVLHEQITDVSWVEPAWHFPYKLFSDSHLVNGQLMSIQFTEGFYATFLCANSKSGNRLNSSADLLKPFIVEALHENIFEHTSRVISIFSSYNEFFYSNPINYGT